MSLAVDAYRVYLLGREFTIQTDHGVLEWLHHLKDNKVHLSNWSLALQPYQFVVCHRAGRANGNADAIFQAHALSNGPCYSCIYDAAL